MIVTCDVGLTCDLIDESIFVAPTNTSYSTTTSTSSLSDGIICDVSLKVENETLKKEVNELTRALDIAYGGDDRFLRCLGIQRFFSQQRGIRLYPQERQGDLCHFQS